MVSFRPGEGSGRGEVPFDDELSAGTDQHQAVTWIEVEGFDDSKTAPPSGRRAPRAALAHAVAAGKPSNGGNQREDEAQRQGKA